jgi:hypothetical protein
MFAASVARMERELESIAGRALEMTEASRALMGVSTGDQNSFFLRLESQVTAILEMFGFCGAAQQEMELTAASLETTIADMRNAVAGIREIEIRIQRIAINAMIRATHIGPAGNALNTIAEVMQGLALDSDTGAESVAFTLDAMAAAAARVSGGSHGAGELSSEIRHMVLELHSSSECSFSRVNQIAVMGARLGENISAVRNGFSAGRLFAAVVNRVCGELERAGAQAGQGPPDGVAAASEPRLERLTERYTMQAERDVHESVAGRAPVTPAPSTAAPPTAPEDGWLGDNVELF